MTRIVCIPFQFLELYKVDPGDLSTFRSKLETLRELPCPALIIGTDSMTDPIERSRGFQTASASVSTLRAPPDRLTFSNA